MGENKTIITVILIGLFGIYLSAFTFIMVVYVAPAVRNRRKNSNRLSVSDNNQIKTSITCSSSNTDFYKKSVQHAENILFNKIVDAQYGEQNYYGNNLIDTINKLNNETKKSVTLAMQYFSIEPIQARANERLFVMMREQEGVPLWFIILRESVKKAVPEFTQESNTIQTENNIVPLYQRTG